MEVPSWRKAGLHGSRRDRHIGANFRTMARVASSKNRVADDAVPDVQGIHPGEITHRADAVERQAVTGIDLDAERMGMFGSLAQALQLLLRHGAGGVAVRAGVQLDAGRTQRGRRLDLAKIRIDEQTDHNATAAQRIDGGGQFPFLAGRVQPALSGQFLAFLRNEADFVRPNIQRNRHDVRMVGHLQVEARVQHPPQQVYVGILDMPPILAQVDGNALRTTALAGDGRFREAGVARTARLPQSGDVIDIDA